MNEIGSCCVPALLELEANFVYHFPDLLTGFEAVTDPRLGHDISGSIFFYI
jgi:hypothetical protein